jgi:Zn-dependent protease with chaperone function
MSLRNVLGIVGIALALPALADGQAQGKLPTAQEVQEWLRKEPMTEASWPAWKQRLTGWFGDRSRQTDAAYRAAEQFCRGQTDGPARLPPRFDQDHLAWYFLGGAYLNARPAVPRDLEYAETAYRRSVAIAPTFARGHRNLALALTHQAKVPGGQAGMQPDAARLKEAEAEIAEARRLEPDLPLFGMHGMVAMHWGRFGEAQRLLEQEMNNDPDVVVGSLLAQAVLMNPQIKGNVAAHTGKLVDRFPGDGPLACLHALALAADGRSRDAATELERARGMGTAPETVLGPQLAAQIVEAGTPSLLERFLWIMVYFVAAYAVVMLLMAGAGLVLAMCTRGTGALDLLQKQSEEDLLADGQIARAQGETVLARLYGLALMAGLVLFYAAIPFVIAGVLGLTGGLLYLIFLGGHIPIKLVVFIAIVGCVSAWAVFKSLFSKPASGSFGLPKTAEECPRIHHLLAEVAQRVDTDPVDEVFIAPGSAVGVHQEGRGPFGIFGVKRRVLTLGLSTVRFLTIGELKAILAHEYAHFSHKDTFYGRFIYQVHLSIEQALHGMLSGGGIFTYANPFYWFLWLYYKSYALLAAGYSRSREFLADRMAATLYGSDQFSRALTKVCTDGTLFEMTVYDHISQLLAEQKAFVNMYQSFQQFRDEQMSHTDREALYQKILTERGSLFASHPTFSERIEAIEALAAAGAPDSRSALELFDRPEEIEQEMTKFLTEYMAYIQYLNAQAAAQQQS